MKSITFSQALVAVGLVGLTLPLTIGQTGIHFISAAYSFDGGPSPVGPIVALAATAAVAMGILATGLVRGRAAAGTEKLLTYPQLLLTIGLIGLLLAGTFSPLSLVFSILTGWDERSWWTTTDAGPLALQVVALAIPLLVVSANARDARRGPSAQRAEITRPFTCLAVLTLVIASSVAPGMAMTPIPYILFSGRYSAESAYGTTIVAPELGIAPELVSLALVACAIPVALLVLLRFNEGTLTGATRAGSLLVTAALLVSAAGFLGGQLLFLFGIPLVALLWPQLTGRTTASSPGSLNSGQLLACAALICLATTGTHALVLAVSFHLSGTSGFEPLPGPTIALGLAGAISLTVLGVAAATLRTRPEIDAE